MEVRRYAGKPFTLPTTHADSCSQSTASAPISYGSVRLVPKHASPPVLHLTPLPPGGHSLLPRPGPGITDGAKRGQATAPRAAPQVGQRCGPRPPFLLRPRRYQATAAPPAGHRAAAAATTSCPAAGPHTDATSTSASSPSTSRLRPRDGAAAAMFSEGSRGGGRHLQGGRRGRPRVKWRRGAEGK